MGLTLYLALITFSCYWQQEIVTLDHAIPFFKRSLFIHCINSHSLLITFKGLYESKTLS